MHLHGRATGREPNSNYLTLQNRAGMTDRNDRWVVKQLAEETEQVDKRQQLKERSDLRIG